jgi:hypothetical protein
MVFITRQNKIPCLKKYKKKFIVSNRGKYSWFEVLAAVTTNSNTFCDKMLCSQLLVTHFIHLAYCSREDGHQIRLLN